MIEGCRGVSERHGFCGKHWQRHFRLSRKEKEAMAKRTEDKKQIMDPSVQKATKAGSPVKARLHDGPMGAGDVSTSKFGKASRDSVSEKEPGKSRGPGG